MTQLKTNSSHAYQTGCVLSFGLILTATGAAKLWSAFGGARILMQPEPMVGIQFRHLMLAAGILEFAIAGACFFGRSQTLSATLVAWLSTMFLAYRLGLSWMGWHRPCPCLGNLTDAINVSPQIADNLMKGVLAYLLVCSYGVLFTSWLAKQKLRT